MKTIQHISLLLFLVFAQEALCAESRAGQVVWWGRDAFWKNTYSAHTNGVIESGGEILRDVVAIAAQHSQALLLKNDGTVFSCGLNRYGGANVPPGLSNVASVAVEGSSFWAIRRDGTVARWGGDEDDKNIVAGLSNITAITWAGYRSYLALKSDSTVLGFRFDTTGPSTDPTTGRPTLTAERTPIRSVRVGGQILSNVVAMASMGDSPLVLKRDGTVLSLSRQLAGPSAISVPPYSYAPSSLVTLDGLALSDVAALASGGGHCLALTSNGTVVAWGNNHFGETAVPADLSNVVAIAAAERQSLALKRDGTVAAWGGNQFGESSVPTGLSNVGAIAAGGWFSLAITTGSVPSSVYIRPHGRLEETAAASDLVFKGRVISSSAITNVSFPNWGNPFTTKLDVISVLKGTVESNSLVFLHLTKGPNAWGGGTPPSHYGFEAGQSYIVFAAKTDKPDWLYSPSSNTVTRPNEFRQPMRGDFAIRALDDRPLPDLTVKDACWLELNRLLTSATPSNSLYAIQQLHSLSKACGPYDDWPHSEDFKREAVLNALLPVLTNTNAPVVLAAIRCFQVGTQCFDKISPHISTLIRVANQAPSPPCRAAAIAALAGTRIESVSNALANLLVDPTADVRAEAVRLLLSYPGEFSERALRERAGDDSPDVRSVVADVIGQGKLHRLLPTLAKLFSDPVGRDKLIPPMTTNFLMAGLRWSNIGDVHTSVGLALVEFPVEQVGDILKTNLNDPGFHINFVSKLAEKDAAPWLPELIAILEARSNYVASVAGLPRHDPQRFADPMSDKILIGAYTKCWDDIRQYLLKLPAEELSKEDAKRYMLFLENLVHREWTGVIHVEEALRLYELYKSRGLTQRALGIRQQYPKMDYCFDGFDRDYPDLK